MKKHFFFKIYMKKHLTVFLSGVKYYYVSQRPGRALTPCNEQRVACRKEKRPAEGGIYSPEGLVNVGRGGANEVHANY